MLLVLLALAEDLDHRIRDQDVGDHADAEERHEQAEREGEGGRGGESDHERQLSEASGRRSGARVGGGRIESIGYRDGMESPRERACPSCGAPAAAPQRWCLECGHELPGSRRGGMRSIVGIATMLAVLVGAASAGGYTILQDDKVPPPPATTVAQTPPATTPSGTLPPATQEPAPYSYTPPPPTSSTYRPGTSTGRFGTGSTTAYPGHSKGGGAGLGGSTGSGSVEPETHTTTTTVTPPPKPRFTVTDIALGAPAVAYAPYAAPDVDLGDPSRTVDGSTRTVWKAPAAADPTAQPQVGVYIDLAGKEQLRSLKLQTPTPGMSIEIYGAVREPPASITDPGWDHLASRAGIATQTKVKLGDRRYQYVLVWIVGAPPAGARPAISELSLLSLQPE